MQGARGNHFTDVNQFKQYGAWLERLVLDQGDGSIAHRTRQHQVHAALHHRVFPGDELHVFARQRLVAIVGDGHAFVVAQGEAGVEHFFARFEDQRVLRMVFAVDAKGVEQGFHVDRQGELIVLLKNRLNQRFTFTRTTGVKLQQTVAASVQLLLQTLALNPGFVDQCLPLLIVRRFKQRQQARAELMLQGVAGRAGVEERVQRFVVPLEQALLRAGLKVRHMQFDHVLLADPVQTADTLFQQVRVGRQVEQHQVMGKLEVATFTADFGTDQYLGAEFFVCEVGRSTVALKNVHAFVEHRRRNTGTHTQGVFQVHRGFSVGADHQHFGALEHFQGVDQPFDARVEVPPAFFIAGVRLGLEADFRVQLGVFAQRQLKIFGRAR